jgi:hypothetical protein
MMAGAGAAWPGRVGVVNSGKGVTEYQGRKRHEFEAKEGEDSVDAS